MNNFLNEELRNSSYIFYYNYDTLFCLITYQRTQVLKIYLTLFAVVYIIFEIDDKHNNY